MKKLFYLIIFLPLMCLWPTSLLRAQSPGIVKDAISVNGLRVGEKYTNAYFVSVLGTPTKVDTPSKTDEYENAYTYYYGKDRFYLIGNEFYGFDLWTSAFAVNGLIRVGDNISKIDQLGGVKKSTQTTRVKVINWRPSNSGLYEWASIYFYYNEDSIITSIGAFINDL